MRKRDLEKSENDLRFCPTCDLNKKESLTKSKTVLQSNNSSDKRSTYYFNYDSDDNLESAVIDGFAGLIDNHYRYLTQYAIDNQLTSKSQLEKPGSTNFMVTVRQNKFNYLMIKRVSSKGVYYFIKFTFIARPEF